MRIIQALSTDRQASTCTALGRQGLHGWVWGAYHQIHQLIQHLIIILYNADMTGATVGNLVALSRFPANLFWRIIKLPNDQANAQPLGG